MPTYITRDVVACIAQLDRLVAVGTLLHAEVFAVWGELRASRRSAGMLREMLCLTASASQGAAGALNSVRGSDLIEVVWVLELSTCGVSAVHAVVGRNFLLFELQLVLLDKLGVKR
jgi:hypothetical protein